MKETENRPEAVSSPKFCKEEILSCNKYKKQQDILSALLDKKKEYSLDEVNKILENFQKGVVELWR